MPRMISIPSRNAGPGHGGAGGHEGAEPVSYTHLASTVKLGKNENITTDVLMKNMYGFAM